MHALANLARYEKVRRSLKLTWEALWAGHLARAIYETKLPNQPILEGEWRELRP